VSTGRLVLAGGSGFLGQCLARVHLAAGGEVDVLTRTPDANILGRPVAWDGATVGDWARILEGAAAVVNLTGKSVNCRYSRANRIAILESRVRSVEALAAALNACANPPPVLVQAASLAIYGNPGDAICDESALPGSGFSVDVCRRWEEAFYRCEVPSTRKVLHRIGFVLGAGGGALEPLARLARLGLGGPAGSGRQYISWLHITDLNRILRWSIDSEDAVGTYNASGPAPVTNVEFMATLRRVLGRPWSPPVPASVVRIGAWCMRTEPELILSGRRCVPRRLVDEGFTFQYPALDAALAGILRPKAS
jgi:uncharacterized protein (TIGR01777 family)